MSRNPPYTQEEDSIHWQGTNKNSTGAVPFTQFRQFSTLRRTACSATQGQRLAPWLEGPGIGSAFGVTEGTRVCLGKMRF